MMLAVLGAGALLVTLLPAPPALHAASLAILLGVLPGVPIARRVAAPRGLAGVAALGVALSPFFAGVAGTLLLLAGVPAPWAARAVAIAAATICAVDAWRGDATVAAPAKAPRDIPVLAVALAGVAIVALAYASNPALARRSDGGFHAAVTLAMTRGGIPPEDPFFSGLRLLYFWGIHVWSSLWLALEPRLAAWTPLVFANLMGAFAALAGIALLARKLGAGAGGVALAAFLALFGAAPFAWVWDVARALSGEVRGFADLGRLLGNGVDVALASMSVGLLHPSLVFSADKLLVSGPFALGLGLACAWTLGMMELMAGPDRRAAWAVALPLAAALFLHAFVGITLFAVGVWTGFMLWLRKNPDGDREYGPSLGPLAIALITPAVALLPYLVAIMLGRHAGTSVRPPRLLAASSLLYGGALLAPAAFLWLGRRREPALDTANAVCSALAFGGLALSLPGDNQTKLFNIFFFVAAAPAAMGWIALGRRAATLRTLVVATLALATLPTLAFCVWACAHERNQGAHDFRAPQGDDALAYAWIAHATPRSALIVDPAVDAGGAATATVSARRSLLWGGDWMAGKWGYAPDALALRRATAQDLAGGWPIKPGSLELLRGMGREIYVVARTGAGGRRSLEGKPGYQRAFTSGAVSVLRWEPPR